MKYFNEVNLVNRFKFDRPLIQKNIQDFDDSDIDSSYSFDDDSDEDEEENENNKFNEEKEITNDKQETKINEGIDILKKKDKKSINKSSDESKSENESDNEDKKKGSFKEDNNRKGLDKNNLKKNIEKDLILSIRKHEAISRENLNLAEKIKFKDEPDHVLITDKYGFIKKESSEKEEGDFKKNKNKIETDDFLQINARIEKWNYMLQNYEIFSKKKFKILKFRTRKGIPDNLRGYVWRLFAEKDKFYVNNLYQELLNKPVNESQEVTILKDLDRTFPLCHLFKEKYGNGQRKLYKVLSSYSKYNPKVGYVQGMGFITAMFLIYMAEESSFFMLEALMKKYGIEDIYYEGFPGLRKRLFILLNLTKKFLPKLYNLNKKGGILPMLYASSWFITLFTKCVDFSISLRIFDCFLLEGIKVIYRFSLALIKLKESEILGSDADDTIKIYTNIHENVKVDELFKTAFGFNLSRNYLQKLEDEYEKVKNDKENEFILQLY